MSQFIPKVSSGVEVRVLNRTFEFFQINLGNHAVKIFWSVQSLGLTCVATVWGKLTYGTEGQRVHILLAIKCN